MALLVHEHLAFVTGGIQIFQEGFIALLYLMHRRGRHRHFSEHLTAVFHTDFYSQPTVSVSSLHPLSTRLTFLTTTELRQSVADKGAGENSEPKLVLAVEWYSGTILVWEP